MSYVFNILKEKKTFKINNVKKKKRERDEPFDVLSHGTSGVACCCSITQPMLKHHWSFLMLDA